MNEDNVLQVLGSLEELNISHSCENSSKIITFQIDSTNFGLLLYATDEFRISFFKLNVNGSLCNDLDPSGVYSHRNVIEKDMYELYLLNVFCFSFSLVDVVCTNKNIFVIGPKTVVDLKSYTESSLKNVKCAQGDEYMDVDDLDEFNPEMFDINVDALAFEKCDFHPSDIFVGCDFLDNGFILCHRLSNSKAWHLELVLLNNCTTQLSDLTISSFLDFPVSFSQNKDISTYQDVKEVDPVIIFVHYNDPEKLMFENLFGINCLPSNAICLVGHPDGKIMWYFCDCKKKFLSSLKLQILCDTKQPVVGIYFMKDIEGLKGSDYLLVVGSLGQITLISSKKCAFSSLVTGPHPFWIASVNLKSSITDCVLIKDCLLHFSSDGKLWITKISKLFSSDQNENICLASNCSELSGIEQMIVVEKNQGLILLKTSSGNLYLTLCQKVLDSEISSSSLPTLMNECLTQSTAMQELLRKKTLQSRLFAAVSTFASLKFSENTLRESIAFSCTEINLQPKKYFLVINLKSFESLHLDPELCYVSASLFTFAKSNNSLVSKTISYNPDEPTLCLELTDTILQPPFFSIFPLLVEVGLILQLPDKWKVTDCFKTISKCFPFYLRIQTFMVHELHLFQSNALCSPESFKFEKPKTYQIIKELGMKRPISNILEVEPKFDYNFPITFNLCLTASSVEELIKNSSDSDACIFIKRLLYGNKQLDVSSEGTCMTSKSCPHFVAVAKKNNTLVITINANTFDSLIALRVAVMDILLSYNNKVGCSSNSSAYVNIPASIYRRCEEISKSLMTLYGSDVESDQVTQSLLQLYEKLRTDVSGKLPIL